MSSLPGSALPGQTLPGGPIDSPGAAVVAAPAVIALEGSYSTPFKTGTAAVTTNPATIAGTGAYIGFDRTGTAAVAGRRPFCFVRGIAEGVLPPPSTSGIRIVNWLRPVL
jgi:hypothetical protein